MPMYFHHYFPRQAWPVVFFVLIATLTSWPTNAMNFLMGRVSSLDSVTGEVIVTVTREDGRSGVVMVRIAPDRLPEEIHEGLSIRMWGEFDEASQVFHAVAIRECRPLWDPTGVRDRLGRGGEGGRGPGRGDGGPGPGGGGPGGGGGGRR